MNLCRRFISDDSGATSVEYAVVLACVLMAVISAVVVFGGQTGTLYGKTETKLTGAGLGK